MIEDMTKLKEKYDSMEEHLKQLTSLINETTNLNTTMKLDILLHKIMDSATRIMKARASSLMLINEETQELTFEVIMGEKKKELNEIRIKIGEGIAGWVAEKGKPLLIEDVSEDERFSKKIDEVTGFETKSIICVPLKVQNKILGIVEVLNKNNGNSFNQEDMEIFTNFANLAAVSIQNTKIYNNLQTLFLKEAQNQLERLDVMSHMAGSSLSSMDFNNLLNAMVEIVLQAIDIESGALFLMSEEQNNLIPVVFRGFHEGAIFNKLQLKISQQISKDLIETKKCLKVEGFIDRFINHGEKIEEDETQVVIGVPIKTPEKMVGALILFSKKGEDISQRDIDFLKNFTGQAALSLEKIDVDHLFGSLKQKSETHKFYSFGNIPKQEEYKLSLQLLAELMETGIVITDEDYNIQLMNKKAELMMGIAKENLQGKNCIDCHSSSLHKTVKKIKDKFEDKGQEDITFEKNFRSENKTVTATVYPVRNAFLNTKGFIMSMKEIENKNGDVIK
jgi:PAS domain S-box-containing protein